MAYIKKLHKFLVNVSKGKFLIITMIMGLCTSIFISVLIQLLFNPLPKPFVDNSKIELFFKALILAPIIETLLNQWFLLILPLKKCCNPTNKNLSIGIFISAFLFGVLHSYSWSYILYAFFIGLYLNYIAVLSVFLRKEKINIFVSVLLIHLFINSFVFIVNLL